MSWKIGSKWQKGFAATSLTLHHVIKSDHFYSVMLKLLSQYVLIVETQLELSFVLCIKHAVGI